MRKIIKLNKQDISYDLRSSSRARNLRLTVSGEAGLVITKPLGLGNDLVEKFLESKAGWILSKIKFFKENSRPKIKIDPKEYRNNKKKALHLVRQLVAEYNQIYNFNINSIKIKNQKTRWGSCSRLGNLNFCYRLILLPEDLARYIVVHELCHLQELNHSAKFWRLVAQACPDYLVRRKKLRLLSLGLQY